MSNNQSFPNIAAPLVNSDGTPTPVWFTFLRSLWNRTGGSTPGGNVTSVSVVSGSGINASVLNSTTTPEITIGLNSQQLNASLAPFSAISQGVVAATGGVTGYFLRSDNSWQSVSSGTVTSVSVVTANGLQGTVATATTTPAITLSVSFSGTVVASGGALTGVTGLSTTVALAKLTTLGNNGSATYTNGILTAYTAPT